MSGNAFRYAEAVFRATADFRRHEIYQIVYTTAVLIAIY
jgi:hypothetical protein